MSTTPQRTDSSPEGSKTLDPQKGKLLAAALAEIEKSYGKGAIMRLGDKGIPNEIRCLSSGAFSLAMAEQCRHAGANALIGKPISAKVLLATITKVLSKPREFEPERLGPVLAGPGRAVEQHAAAPRGRAGCGSRRCCGHGRS